MDSLKYLILENEKILLKNFEKEYGLAIKFFIKKIEALDKDGDIVKFLNNGEILKIKKDQYDLFHENGFKTAIDIMQEYDKKNIEYTKIDHLEIEQLLSNMTISALANNFNIMRGMYYLEDEDILLLKTQIKNGPYGDRWLKRNEQLLYYLQTERKEENYSTKNFGNFPNLVCSDIIEGKRTKTKVYLFYRYSSGNRYFFGGQYQIDSFSDNNKSIILTKKTN